jgi:hypothetical protein
MQGIGIKTGDQQSNNKLKSGEKSEKKKGGCC